MFCWELFALLVSMCACKVHFKVGFAPLVWSCLLHSVVVSLCLGLQISYSKGKTGVTFEIVTIKNK